MKRLLRRTLYAGSAAACGIILWGAESASATDGDGGLAPVDQVQEALVDNSTSQGGTADISNLQINLNAPVAIGSPGANSGDVSQSNDANNSAAVVNNNATEQSVEQSQDGSADASGGDANGGGDGGDGTAIVDQGQSAGVSNATDQSGDASVDNQQINVNIPVAVLSPGANSGDVDQSNTANNSAAVINTNATDQAVGQSQTGDATASGGDATGGGDGCNECSRGDGDGGDGTAIVDQDQSADVDNSTSQGGSATVDNTQENVNASAPTPLYGVGANRDGGDHNDCGCQPAPDGGDVDQSNTADNSATVVNTNSTEQDVEQSQRGDANARGGDASGGGDGGDGTAIVGQEQCACVSNRTDQGGDAAVNNEQFNLNLPVSIGSHGANSGDVDQSNRAHNSAAVINSNSTEQAVGQSQRGDANASGGDASGGGDGCGCESHSYERDGNNNGCNECSRGDGDGGDGTAIVDQGQSAYVDNGTSQGGSAYVDNSQENINGAAPRVPNVLRDSGDNNDCRCHPAPDGGDVDQSNRAHNSATVLNVNSTEQDVGQSQRGDANASGGDASGGGDGGDGTAIVDQGQRAGVSNATDQSGDAAVNNEQLNKNLNGPARKPGLEHNNCGCEPTYTTFTGGGDNHDCGCHPAPRGGDVDQSNTAENSATVGNINGTTQSVGQSQDGTANASGGDASGGRDGCGCEHPYNASRGGDNNNCGCKPDRNGGDGGDGTAIVDQGQAARISNETAQRGSADVGNEQKNVNRGFGKVEQSNEAANLAALRNGNATGQPALQRQIAKALAEAG